MRRRQRLEPGDVPVKLLRYRREDWPEGGPQGWYDARDQWRDVNGDGLPTLDESSNAPDVPFHPSQI